MTMRRFVQLCWLALGVVLLSLVYVGSAAAQCPDGTAGDDPALTCTDNSNTNFDGLGGNDTMTVTNSGGPGLVFGDGNGTGWFAVGNGGNDIITNDGTVSDFIMGDGVLGNGGNDVITNNGTVGIAISGDYALSNGGHDSITNNGTVGNIIMGDNAGGNGGNDVITNNGTVSHIWGDNAGGNGGNDVITNNGTVTGNIIGDNVSGTGGNDTIINNGVVNAINGEGGDDQVFIRVGSTVTLFIDGGPHITSDILTFTDVTAALQAAIQAAQAGCPDMFFTAPCTITINVRGTNFTYTAFNFEGVAFLLAAIAQNLAEQGVVIDTGGIVSFSPQELCQGKVKVFRLANGDLEVYSGFDVLPPNGFLVAVIPLAQQVVGRTFSNPAAPIEGWTAVLDAADGRVRVFDGAGNLVSDECRTR